MEAKLGCICFLILVLFSGGMESVSATTSRRFLSGFLSNRLSVLLKWLAPLSPFTSAAVSPRPMMKFESGYEVETVFDGSKLGIDPYAVVVLPGDDLLVLDSVNSNIYKISQPLSRYGRPKLIAGSSEGSTGHVDGRTREARMNHPKSFTVDDRGNIYVADTLNRAIRKISDMGVTTIAGGRWNRGSNHVDGPSEDAKFSDDFEVVYVGSSCSLLIIDRGNKAIREIQLHFDDCIYQYGTGFPLGVLVLLAAGFFGYMLALVQRRVSAIVSSSSDSKTLSKVNLSSRPTRSPISSPLIPSQYEWEKSEAGLFFSLWNHLLNFGATLAAVLGSYFSVSRRKPENVHYLNKYQKQQDQSTWPMQESFLIPDEDEPPSIDTRTPTPRKTYPFMSKDAEKMNHFWLGRGYYNGRDGECQQKQKQQHLHHQRYSSAAPDTFYEESSEGRTEIVFGAIQEDDKRRRPVERKGAHNGDFRYDYHNARKGVSHVGYSSKY